MRGARTHQLRMRRFILSMIVAAKTSMANRK
jgi:hypothetical protein